MAANITCLNEASKFARIGRLFAYVEGQNYIVMLQHLQLTLVS